jgi:hypothetical protein
MAMLFASTIWGVDSYAPANRPAQNCLYDQVVKRKKPAFWGRYIRCPNASDSNVLNTDEARFLHDRGCAILPIYNRTVYQRNGPSWTGTFGDGVADAMDAIAAAASLGIPPGVWIYADIEPAWPNVSTNWILGWWCVMAGAYRPGLYTTLQGKYTNAVTMIRSMQPPAGMSFIDLIRWRSVPNIDTTSYVWSFNPHRGSFTNPPAWEPMAPPQCAAHVKLWQYCANELVGGNYVDADLATPDALAGMWQPPTPFWQA